MLDMKWALYVLSARPSTNICHGRPDRLARHNLHAQSHHRPPPPPTAPPLAPTTTGAVARPNLQLRRRRGLTSKHVTAGPLPPLTPPPGPDKRPSG